MISGLDREIVYGCGLVSYVVPVPDGFFLGDLEREGFLVVI